ncbi:methylaspartate mutase [Salinispora fenicalii]|uniref:methylaspartate mutase n=1 Tax=Salinispora fenicalii TaxID=1137263 RepID=UPI000483CD8C|nr:methylaspartate mutase [Salinispora fenicalii]
MTAPPGTGFAGAINNTRRDGLVVVQPRMGFAEPSAMRAGLVAVRDARATTVGTITLDSYTRVGDLHSARTAVRTRTRLNGYPLCTHPDDTTRSMLSEVYGPGFPIQVRHGSARPGHIIEAMARIGLDATEGGPVSYCLPYGRTPLRSAISEWSAACDRLAEMSTPERPAHLESFGGCMLGQMCPPSLLVAIAVLEGLFFAQHGVPSISLSYAQQTQPEQDLEALAALRRLIDELLPGLDVHVVLYTYMGVFPRTRAGSSNLLDESARIAVFGGAERLIVKTVMESVRIPDVADNVAAVERAEREVRCSQQMRAAGRPPWTPSESGLYEEARTMIDAVRSLDPDLGTALHIAFRRGLLDVPYCLHPDTQGRTRSRVAPDGRLEWAHVGSLPIDGPRPAGHAVGAQELTSMLNYVADRFDSTAAAVR